MDNFWSKQILKALDNPDQLTEWEHGFVDSLADKEDGYTLSSKQKEILLRIGEGLG